MSRDPKHRPTATQLMNELDSLVRLKSTSGKNLPPPVQPAQPLTRIGSSLKKPASLSKDQVQSLSRKSAAPTMTAQRRSAHKDVQEIAQRWRMMTPQCECCFYGLYNSFPCS